MPKIKSKRALMKRIRISGKGRVKRYSAYRRHILTKMTRKRKRQLRGLSLVNCADMKLVKRMLNLKSPKS